LIGVDQKWSAARQTGYLENAIRFERLAAEASDLASKTEFRKQAISYRKLAAERARKLGIPEPPGSIGL
jgi:hypothetical protein